MKMLDNFTTEKKSLQNQKVTPVNAIDDYYFRNPEGKRAQYRGICWVYAIIMAIAVGACAFSLIKSCAKQPAPAMLKSHSVNAWTPELNTYAKYRRYVRTVRLSKRLEDKRLLAELEAAK